MARVDPYAILGVSAMADTRELAAAYRRQAKRWHPDRGGGEEAARRMAEINAAYDLLRAGFSHEAAAGPPQPPSRRRAPRGGEGPAGGRADITAAYARLRPAFSPGGPPAPPQPPSRRRSPRGAWLSDAV